MSGVQGQSPWPCLPEPFGLLDGEVAISAIRRGDALPLAGGPAAFALVRINGRVVRATEVPGDRLAKLSYRPPSWAGLPVGRPAVMGILNVTPDSFSDGGLHKDPVAAGRAMLAAGADLLDIGGESTRPGSAPISIQTECARVLPVIAGLAGAALSIDTRNAATMAAALDAGATAVNDISALADPDAAALLAARGCPVILMHMRGTPSTMDRFARYHDVALEVAHELAAALALAERAGIVREKIAIDPGIGFAKTAAHNLELLQRLPLLLNLGCRLVVGVSRKRFIGSLGGAAEPRQRGPGSLAGALYAAARGASVLRVHDVADTVQALRIWQGIAGYKEMS